MEKINETNRIVVEFASIFDEGYHYPLSQSSQVWLVCESNGPHKAPIWKSIHGITEQYTQIGQLCRQGNAIQAEFGERLVDGKRLSAQAYLGVWRKAATMPTPVQQLAKMGIGLQISLSKSLPGFKAAMQKDSSTIDFQALLDSPFVSERTASTLTWSIPITTLENCLVYCSLKNIWLNKEDFPEPVFERFEVLAAQERNCAAAVMAPPRVHETFDLFAFAGVAGVAA